jgi:hypothetical protein
MDATSKLNLRMSVILLCLHGQFYLFVKGHVDERIHPSKFIGIRFIYTSCYLRCLPCSLSDENSWILFTFRLSISWCCYLFLFCSHLCLFFLWINMGKNIANMSTLTFRARLVSCSFFGSLGVGAGGPVSHRAMQKLTWAFRLVAHNEFSCISRATLV